MALYNQYSAGSGSSGGLGATGRVSTPQNSYTGTKSRFGGMTDQIFNKFVGGAGGGSGSGGGFSFGMNYPKPDDPMVGGYLNNLRGGSANMVNDAVKRMATAGASRGGTGAIGGPNAASTLSHGAVGSIARLFPQMYDQSMGYAKDYYGRGNDYFKTLGSLIPSMMSSELGAAQGEGNFDLSTFGTLNQNQQRGPDYERQRKTTQEQWGREDELDQRDYDRGAFGRELQRVAANQEQSARQNRPVDPSARANTLESIIEQYNRNQQFGSQINMAHMSDLLAKIQGTGGYGTHQKSNSPLISDKFIKGS